jgi:histidine phosphotransfer protein HptB
MTDQQATPVLDLEQVAELFALDQGSGRMFARFVDLFVSRTGERILKLHEHAKTGNAAALAEGAHSLRGASGNVGAVRLSALLARIEIAAKKPDLATAADAVALLDAEYAVTRAALLAAIRRT